MLEAEIQRPPIVFNPGNEAPDVIFKEQDGVEIVEGVDSSREVGDLGNKELSFLTARDSWSTVRSGRSSVYFTPDEGSDEEGSVEERE
jgi:hypothetical protein